MPYRDIPFLEDQIGAGPVEEALEPLHEIAALLASLLPELAQGRARLVAYSAVRLERAAQQIGERLDPWQPHQRPRQLRRLHGDGAAVGGEPRAGVEEGEERGELRALGNGAGHARPLQERTNVGNRFPG